MTIRELIDEPEGYGDHVEVRRIVAEETPDRTSPVLAVAFNDVESVVHLVTEEE